MAQKRMFDKKVVESDKFIDLPNSSKALYFMAGMDADDKGFFQPRKLQRMCGFSDDDFKILIAKGFFITFESGVMVVTDWNKNNWLDSRRINETEYIDELNLLKLINQRYEFKTSQELAKPPLSENSIDKNSIEYNIYNNTCANDKANAISIEALFESFWIAYPKKKNKGSAEKWFKSHKPTKELVDTMIEKIEQQKNSKDWLKNDGQFIPYPSTWLNAKAWEDETIEKNVVPSWFNKEIKQEQATDDEIAEMDAFLKEYR